MSMHQTQRRAATVLSLLLVLGRATLAAAAREPRPCAGGRVGGSSSSSVRGWLVQEHHHHHHHHYTQWLQQQQHNASHRRLLTTGDAATAPPPTGQQQADAVEDATSVLDGWTVAPGGGSNTALLPWGARASATAAPDDRCPGCLPGNCVEAEGGYACQGGCAGGLFLSTSDGTCGCPPGKYGPAASDKGCKDCEKTFFCTGGRYTGPGSPPRMPCATFSLGLTTTGARASSKRQCVNDQGFSYNVDADTQTPSASPCGVNSYGPGLKKQRSCVPCGEGLSTNGKTQQTSAKSCLIAPGYYFSKTANKVMPCPQGEWQSEFGSVASGIACTRCTGLNVVTAAVGSTSIRECNVVLPGSFPTAMTFDGVVTATARCPQNMLCPGGKAQQAIDPNNVPEGDPTIRRCPRGLWTKNTGTVTEDQCLVPPGFFLPPAGASMAECADGSFRAGWGTPAEAAACTKCSPDGSILSMATDMLVRSKPDGSEFSKAVKGGKASCYILAGMGLVFDAATETFKGVNCDKNNWGVSGINFGLDTRFACKPCPDNLVTSNNVNTNPISASFYKSNGGTPPLGGFTGAGACVTKCGWGVYGRAAQPCPAGSWSAGDTQDACAPCNYGLTTHPNLTQCAESDCVLDRGFGVVRKLPQPCPVGTFNDEVRLDATSPCTPCPGGSTTSIEGATTRDACNLCKPGSGGAECAACGGARGTFSGPGLRPIGEPCKDCPGRSAGDGFTFDSGSGSDNAFAPRIVATSGAVRPEQCFAEFVQVADGAWNLAMRGADDWGRLPDTTASFDGCVELCRAEPSCQFLQFNYAKPQGNCQLKVVRSATGSDILALKAVASANVGAASASSSSTLGSASQRNSSEARAMGVIASGKYTFWRDDKVSRVGLTQTDAPMGEPLSWESCVLACDDDNDCAGVWMRLQAPNLKPSACRLVFGDTTPRTFLRAMTRTAPDAMDILDLWPDFGR